MPGLTTTRPGRQASDLLVAAFVLMLPFGLRDLGPLQLVQVGAVLLVVATLVLRPSLTAWSPALARLSVPGTALLLAAGIATPFSADSEATFRADLQLVIGIGLTVTVAVAVSSWASLCLVLGLVTAAGAGVAVHAIATAGAQETEFAGGVVSGRAQGVFSQPNELGAFLAALIVLGVGGWGWAATRMGRLLALAAVAVMAGGLVLSLSRGAWVGTLFGVTVLAVLVPTLRVRLAGLLAVTTAALVGFLAVVDMPALAVAGGRLATIADPTDNPYDNRTAIYAEAWQQIGQSPVFGHGPGSFPTVAAETTLGHGAVYAEHAHNLVLTTATEYGVVGLVALTLLVLSAATWTWRAVRGLQHVGRQREAVLCAALGAALATVLAHGMVDYPLRNPVTFFTCWFLLGLLVAATLRAGRSMADAAPADGPPVSTRPAAT